jgi:uncharacterized protein (DUF433 family)
MSIDSRTGQSLLTQPYYTFSEADYLAGVARGTARRWIIGYRYRGRDGDAVQRPPGTPRTGDERSSSVSWVDLVEIVAIGLLKEKGFSLRRIRDIVQLCQDTLGEHHPLAMRKFKTDGRAIFLSLGDHLLDVSHWRRKGMMVWDTVLGPFLETLDYDGDLARRWWPMGRERLIVIDPEYGFGYPVIVNTGVRTEFIAERFAVGESVSEIANDFDITPAEVDDALRFELHRHAA